MTCCHVLWGRNQPEHILKWIPERILSHWPVVTIVSHSVHALNMNMCLTHFNNGSRVNLIVISDDTPLTNNVISIPLYFKVWLFLVQCRISISPCTHYEREGILEIVPWPIDQFRNSSAGWNITIHPGDLHYYGQLVTLNECIYRQMYQSKYVLLNDIDEIIMPYKYANLPLLMEDLRQKHKSATVFLIENHIFPKTQFEDSGKFVLPEWKNIPVINIMEHIYREPDRKNIYNPTKMIVNPRNMMQTSVHSSLKHTGDVYRVPLDVCRIVHVRTPLQGSLTKE
ncbi:uncharacterized protein Hap1MRO34_011274 [Clarias gariepinus]